MARKPAPKPTLEELAWALHDAMIDTPTQLHSLWHGYGHRSFWMHAARNIDAMYEYEICDLGECANITPRGVWRHVRANLTDLVRRLTDIFEGDDFFIDIDENYRGRYAA